MSTDTPRTDDQSVRYYNDATGKRIEYVPSRFARQLERELASAQAEKKKWEQIACDKLIEVCMQIEEKKIVTEQRDRLAEALERILSYQGRFAEEDPESIATEALQSLTTNEL
jgi:acyl-CoA reductase-like NAD-dependent aldehyde dehydrogenase